MISQLIIKNIEKHVPLSRNEQEVFISYLHSTKVDKKERILTEGNHCDYIYFVNAGILRAFFNHEGKESTIMFAKKDWWITDMNAFTNQLPAILSIEAIAPSEIMLLSKKNMEKLFEEIPKLEKFFRIIFQRAYIREQTRTVQNLSLPAKVRYENFIEKYPEVAHSVAQKHIASYLGITPEFLSVIRANKA